MKVGLESLRRTARCLCCLCIGIAMLWPGFGTAAVEGGNTAIDLMFVVDNSGSMRKNDPEFITPKVVNAFVRQLPPNAHMGMVLFDRSAKLLEPLASMDTEQAQRRWAASLSRIDYKGQFTNSAVGFERALYELKNKGRKEAQKGIVFITDGITDTGDQRKDQELNQWLRQDFAAESRELDVRIFGIAFTDAADFVLIQALASRTEGEYYRTYDASEILGVLDDILTYLQPPKPEPKPKLMPPQAPQPLSTLPEPQEQAISEAERSDMERREDTTSGVDIFNLILALLTTAVALGIAFLYVKQYRSKRKSDQEEASRRKQPEAYLEDLDRVTGQEENRIEITKRHTTIGRDQRNDITIVKPTISSFHATIEYKNVAYYIEDQRSTNGTKLNGQALQANSPLRLKSGDSIDFSTFHFKFSIPEQMPFGETVMVSITELEGPESGSTVVIDLNGQDSEQGLISCMQSHLLQLYSMGPKYKQFAANFFPYEILEAIATKAHENLKKTEADGKQYCVSLVKRKTFYLVCSLPVPVNSAVEWYNTNHQGFTKFIMQWIRSTNYESAQCDQLCVFTFGQDPATWASLTIVPTNEEDDPVEIISVDFLSEEEKGLLALDFDHHGRVM